MARISRCSRPRASTRLPRQVERQGTRPCAPLSTGWGKLFMSSSGELRTLAASPSAATIDGISCMGGGFELALASDDRIASDSEYPLVGLPKVRLGLILGGGGTQRVASGRCRRRTPGDAVVKGDQIPACGRREDGPHPRGGAGWTPSCSMRQASGKRPIRTPSPGGRPEVQAAVGRFSPAGMMMWPPANALYRKRDLRQLPWNPGDPVVGVRRPATADGPRAHGREQAPRQRPAHEGSRGDDSTTSCRSGELNKGVRRSSERAADVVLEARRPRQPFLLLHGRGHRRRFRQ